MGFRQIPVTNEHLFCYYFVSVSVVGYSSATYVQRTCPSLRNNETM